MVFKHHSVDTLMTNTKSFEIAVDYGKESGRYGKQALLHRYLNVCSSACCLSQDSLFIQPAGSREWISRGVALDWIAVVVLFAAVECR